MSVVNVIVNLLLIVRRALLTVFKPFIMHNNRKKIKKALRASIARTEVIPKLPENPTPGQEEAFAKRVAQSVLRGMKK